MITLHAIAIEVYGARESGSDIVLCLVVSKTSVRPDAAVKTVLFNTIPFDPLKGLFYRKFDASPSTTDLERVKWT